MMKVPNSYHSLCLLVTAVHLFLAANDSFGALVFSRVGNDLQVELRQPIVATFSVGGSSLSQALVIDGLFSSAVGYSGRGIVVGNTIAVSITGGLGASTIAGTWGVVASNFIDLNKRDFYLGFNMRSAFIGSFSPGDSITFSAGSGTIRDYFIEGGVLPDRLPSTVRVIEGFTDGSRIAVVAGPVPIPESSSVLPIFAAAYCMLRRSRKAQQAGAGQPATRPADKQEGGDKPQPEVEGRSR